MKIILTGAHGYLGTLLTEAIAQKGWKCIASLTASDGKKWRLPNRLHQECFSSVDALIHCAWDMKSLSKQEAHEINVEGSRILFQQAQEAGIKKIIFISSLSAYEGCCSHYGQAKLAVEKNVLAVGGIVIRPGLIYGEKAGGMIGKLVKLIKKLPLLLLPCASTKQYFIQEQKLVLFILRCILEDIPSGVYSLGEEPQTMKAIIRTLAESQGCNPLIIPIHWRIVWAGLRLAEMIKLPLPVHSDNLIGLAKSNPHPNFTSFYKIINS